MVTPETDQQGWSWFERARPASESMDDLCRCAAMSFGTPQGRLLLAHLQRTFLDRRVPPTASDAELRHVEGQRSVVHHLLQLLERGRGGPAVVPTSPGPGVSS